VLIFCCGMNRGGSTLQYQIVAKIIESNNIGIALGWIGIPNPETLTTLDNIARRRDKYAVVKCHQYATEAGAYIELGKAKGVYIYRDIRDVVVSMGHKFFDSIDSAIENNCVSNSLNDFYGWSALRGVYTSQYEEVILDLASEVKSIASFLELELQPSQITAIAQSLNLDRQKEKIASFNYQVDGIDNSDEEKNIQDYYDPVSQLHNQHIRSGKHGQWQTELTSEQLSYIEHHAFSWLVDRQYSLSTVNCDRTKTAEEHYELGRQQSKKEDFTVAIVNFQQAIMQCSSKPLYHFQLGLALFKAERYSEAVNAYRHAIYLNSQSALYHRRLAEALVELEQLEAAVDVYRQAIELEPGNPQHYSSLAEVFVRLERPQKAVANLKKVIQLNQINR